MQSMERWKDSTPAPIEGRDLDGDQNANYYSPGLMSAWTSLGYPVPEED
jgi:hypothetical protein